MLTRLLQADKLQTLITAAKVPDVEPIWTSLFAKALEGKDVKELLMNIGSGGGAAAAAPAAAGGAGDADAGAAKEEEKEEGMICATFPTSMSTYISLLTLCLQRRKNPTTTWDSVSSIKHVATTLLCLQRETENDRRIIEAYSCCSDTITYTLHGQSQFTFLQNDTVAKQIPSHHSRIHVFIMSAVPFRNHRRFCRQCAMVMKAQKGALFSRA